MRSISLFCLLLMLLVAIGCDASNGEVNPSIPNANDCIPNESDWSTIRPIVENACGLCHGDPPQFGAPYSLLDYTELFNGDSESRILDTLVREVRTGEMPPVGQPALSAIDQAALLDWATCGTNAGTPPPGPLPGGFDVSRPIFPSPDTSPNTTNVVEWRASGGTIDADEADRYMCFSFSPPGEGPRLIRRFEPIVDDTRVLHHIVLYEVESGPGDGSVVDCGAGLATAVYAWAPGQRALQFVEGGLVTGPDRSYILEIHYNNTAELTDVADESGVRIFHEPTGAMELDMLTIGPEGFRLPANSRTEVSGDCAVESDLSIVAAFPHMHETGQSLKSTIIRADGTTEDLITLTGWDFNTQLFYDTSMIEVGPGDTITTQCIFENLDSRDRVFGPYTRNEMCYNFLYVTPPPANRYCDQSGSATAQYQPGVCAPDGAEEIGQVIRATFHEGTAPAATGGIVTPGLYRLVADDIYLASANLGPITLDLERSFGEVAGVLLWTTEGDFALDLEGTTHAMGLTDVTFDRPVSISVNGSIEDLNTDEGTFTLITGCPEEGRGIQSYSVNGNRIEIRNEFTDPAPGSITLHFEPVE